MAGGDSRELGRCRLTSELHEVLAEVATFGFVEPGGLADDLECSFDPLVVRHVRWGAVVVHVERDAELTWIPQYQVAVRVVGARPPLKTTRRVKVPSPLSVILWSWPFAVKTMVNVPPVSRLVNTSVPRTLSR